jgi:RNA polymerase sigma factor for flagellar operon FliA
MHATLSRDLRSAVDGPTARRAEDHLPLVRATVGRVARRVPRHVERDDLMGAGMEGLAQALRSFEPSRGVCFETFAARRIRGAVLDELRRRDWAGRAVRSRARRVSTASDALVARLGRIPSLDEVAAAAQLPRQDVADLVVHLERAARLERRMAAGPGDDSGQVEVADAALGPEATLLEAELRDAVRDAVAALPDRLRWAVVGHFGDGREMKSLAEDLGVTPSRVSQLCREAVSLLREGVAARLDPGTDATWRPAGGAAGRRRAAYLTAMVQRSGRGPDDGGPQPAAA